jgi:hypothetical protein
VSYIGCVTPAGPNQWALTISEIPSATATTGATAGTQNRTGAETGNARVGDSQVSGQAQVNRGSQPTGTTGGMTATVGQQVQLIGSGRTNLSAHSGHKVEVTGTLAPQGAAQGRTTGQPAAEMRLNVNNVRMISATCDAGTSSPQPPPRNQGSGSTTPPGTPGAAGTSGTTEPSPATGSEPTTTSQPENPPQRQQ